MVYIYKKTIGERDYFYLRASVRKGKKAVTKDIAYLGSSPEEIRKNLDNLPKAYEKDIRKAYYRIHSVLERNKYHAKAREMRLKGDEFLPKELLEEVEACKLHYQEFLKQHDKQREDVYGNFVIEFAYNTTSIEGNTITLNEAARLLSMNLTPKDRELREIYDIQNTRNVFFEILNNMPEISHETIIGIHTGLMKNIDARIGYRNYNVRVFKSHFDSSPAEYVKADMNLLVNFYNKHEKQFHPLSLAAMFHHKFEKIHPFADGNGRTGRMLLNLILLKHGYPPVIIAKKERGLYLDALSECDNVDLDKADKMYKSLTEFAAWGMINSYWGIFP